MFLTCPRCSSRQSYPPFRQALLHFSGCPIIILPVFISYLTRCFSFFLRLLYLTIHYSNHLCLCIFIFAFLGITFLIFYNVSSFPIYLSFITFYNYFHLSSLQLQTYYIPTFRVYSSFSFY